MNLYRLTDYRLTPSVLRVGVPVTLTVTPTGENSAFEVQEEYEVQWCATATATQKLRGCDHETFHLRPQNGCLTFTVTPESEQLYVIKILPPERLRYCQSPYYQPPQHGRVPRHSSLRMPVLHCYALADDLYGMNAYKGDLHIHSTDSDGHESSVGVIANLKRAGYDFLALTNHYWYHSREKVLGQTEGFPDVITLMPGEEIHVPSEYIHAVGIGHSQSVNDEYYQNRERCEAEIAAIEETLELPEDTEKHNFACHVWIARKVREYGGLPIQVHPYWVWNEVYFTPEAVNRELFERKVYDAFEVLNEGSGTTNRLQAAFYLEERGKGYDLPAVGSSDSHCTDSPDDALPAANCTVIFAPDRQTQTLCDAIRDHRSVAVEFENTTRLYHLYGEFRMVKYADFLLQNYFPVYREFCYEQGRLLKEYAVSHDPALAALAEQLKERSDAYATEFFGHPVPDSEKESFL